MDNRPICTEVLCIPFFCSDFTQNVNMSKSHQFQNILLFRISFHFKTPFFSLTTSRCAIKLHQIVCAPDKLIILD